MTVYFLFELPSGKLHKHIEHDATSLEDATINATNMAEDKGWELLSVDTEQF